MEHFLQRTLCGLAVISALNLSVASAQTAPPAVPLSELVYTPTAPCRAFSTALPVGTGKNLIVAGTTAFPSQGGTSGGCGVPDSATAVSVSLTVSNAAGQGTITAYSAGTPTPAPATALSFTTSFPSTATSIVGIKSKRIALVAVGHSAQVSGDITGYFAPPIAGLLNGDGTLSSATSRVLSASRSGTGAYYVTVDRNVRNCSIQASPYNLGRYASVGLSDTRTPQIFSISVWSLNSTAQTIPTDYPVFFHVVC